MSELGLQLSKLHLYRVKCDGLPLDLRLHVGQQTRLVTFGGGPRRNKDGVTWSATWLPCTAGSVVTAAGRGDAYHWLKLLSRYGVRRHGRRLNMLNERHWFKNATEGVVTGLLHAHGLNQLLGYLIGHLERALLVQLHEAVLDHVVNESVDVARDLFLVT